MVINLRLVCNQGPVKEERKYNSRVLPLKFPRRNLQTERDLQVPPHHVFEDSPGIPLSCHPFLNLKYYSIGEVSWKKFPSGSDSVARSIFSSSVGW